MEQPDEGIAKGCYNRGRVAKSHMGSIFLEEDIARIMQAVFNTPMLAPGIARGYAGKLG